MPRPRAEAATCRSSATGSSWRSHQDRRGTLRVGLRYRDDVPDDERLEPAKGFAQATHWVHLAPDADAASLEPLIRAAYEQN